MGLKSLQNALRIKPRVLIVKAGDVTERDDVVFRSINPAAAVFLGGERPAHGVDDLAFFDGAGRNLPQLFHPDAVDLRVAALLQIVSGDKLLGQRSTRAFGQYGNFRFQVVTGLEVRLLLVLLVYAFIVGANAGNLIAFDEQFLASKTGKNGDAGLLNFLSQPFHKAVNGDHVVAVVL